MIRFKKIKITSDDKINLEYENLNKQGNWDEHTMKSAAEPLPSFHHALDNLIPHVVDICELPKGDNLSHSYTVKGVSLSYGGENEVMGATITATRSLAFANSPLVLNTPHKAEDVYSPGGGEDMLLTDECVADLYKLIDEAEKYLSGKRAQADLFEDDPEPEPEMSVV